MMLMVGDIGGTKTELAIFSTETGPYQSLVNETYPSSNYKNLEVIVSQFLQEVDMPVNRACFGVAGPVIEGRAKITNLPWVIDASNLKSTFGWDSVNLINDLEAVAYSIPILKQDDIFTLNKGKPEPNGNIAIIAPGTGLGEGFLTSTDNGYYVQASEGGHASFSPTNTLEDGLLKYLREQEGYEHVSIERVCSGGFGIPNIYNYLKEIEYAEEPDWLSEQLEGSPDPTPIIIDAAKDKNRSTRLCKTTLDMFMNILGAEAGNFALKVLATGGIYLGGGIVPRILDQIQQPLFLENLWNKGRFRKMLSNIPVHVIMNNKSGLMGAAAYEMGGYGGGRNE
jgi:glucokinase